MDTTLKQLTELLTNKSIGKTIRSSSFQLWLVRVVNLVVVVLLASVLAKLTWLLVFPGNNALPKAVNQHTKQDKVAVTVRLNSISDLALFGRAEAPPVQDAPIVAPETRLQLKLKGVFASSDPLQAFAIISDNKNQDKAYRLGSTVSGGAILHAVYADRVILKRNGRLETLRMTITYDDKGNKSTYRESNNAAVVANKRTINAGAKLRALKQTLLKDPQEIWKQVRISPVLKDGSIRGYSIDHEDKQLMRSLTLQKGDVITAVNGQLLSDPSVLYSLMGKLTSQKNIDVTIERNGQVQVIQLQL